MSPIVILFVSALLTCSSYADVAPSGVQQRDMGALTSGATAGSTERSPAIGDARQYFNGYGTPGGPSSRRRCPLCDSSVYVYCGEKLLHDACCCTNPYQHPLPYKCQLADCGFLHANTCKEHRLISNCCCSDEYRSLLRGNTQISPSTSNAGSVTIF